MKQRYSCTDLAIMALPGFPSTAEGWKKLVERECWPFAEEKSRGRGGIKRLYVPPPAVLKKIRAQEQAIAAVHSPTAEQQVIKAFTRTLVQLQDDEKKAKAARDERAREQLRMLAGGLSAKEALSLTAHCEIAEGWQVWFVKKQPMKRSHSWNAFANAYNLAEVPVSKAVRDAYPEVSGRSVQRWVTDYERGNFEALVDRRNGSDRKGKTLFATTPLLAAYAKKILLERPGIKTEQLTKLLATAAIDDKTGEILFKAPSYTQVWRFQTAWIEENRDLYTQATNPDAFKNSTMLAFGSYSADVHALNQRWEMDATPADWLLLDSDGQKRRYTVSVIVDVWSRRAIVVVAKTPKTQTHCYALRIALMAWGVPAEIVTDNGADYQSDHFKRVLKALGVEHITRNPFSPEEKPHVERFIGTLNHSILELLPNFAGHNVADRKAIEARRSFAERLKKKGELVDFADIVDGSCTGEALQEWINTWLQGSYEHDEHGGLKTTPFLKASSWTGEVRRITDERSLDLLLARPADGGVRTLQKKGIKLDNAWFIHPALATIQMGSQLEVYETEDLGKIVVYHDREFLCIAENPERTGANRAEIAAAADAIQKERLKEARARIKAETRGLPKTDEVLARHLNERAMAAGKLVQPKFGQAPTVHTSQGLEQAAIAAKALDKGWDEPTAGIPPELAAFAARRNVVTAQPQAEESKATAPKVAQLRKDRTQYPPETNYREWKALEARVICGQPIEDPADARWFTTYPSTAQFRAMQKRFELERANAPAQGMAL